MIRAHDDAARRAQYEADIAATTAMEEAELLQQPEPTWAKFGYAIVVSALWAVSGGFVLGAVLFLLDR